MGSPRKGLARSVVDDLRAMWKSFCTCDREDLNSGPRQVKWVVFWATVAWFTMLAIEKGNQ